jgi:ABC-type Na+ efflux pump permease subunit
VEFRKLLRIARWEVTKNAGGVDRRTVLVGVGAVVLLGLVAPSIAGGGVALDKGIYRVGIADDNPYHPVAADDETFAVVPADREALRTGSVDLLVTGATRAETSIVFDDDAKGRAAYEAFRSSIEGFNDRQLGQELNETAAFPVSVVLRYEQQDGLGNTYRVETGGGDSGDATAGGDSDGSADGSDGGDASEGSGDGAAGGPQRVGDGGVGPSDGGLGGLGSGVSGGTTATDSPSRLAPPFPFRSLVLAFVFVIPLNFLIQAYGSTILSERLNRRGELMLVSPVSRAEIIGGKTLPYFLGAMAVESVIAVGLTLASTGSIGGALSVAAVTPLVLLFLSATFLGAMFARSFKELTFVTVTITVALTSYAFVPAIFTDVGAVALVSPLTLVVRDLQNQAVSLVEFAFSTVPPLLTSFVLFGLGAGLYREEDMFAQRPIPLKVLDALAGRIYRPWHVGLLTALLLPFVFVLELLAIAMLFALGELSIPLVLVAVAVVEEIGKSLHVYASYAHRRFERGLRTAMVLGIISGVGFFLAEKLTVLAQVVGIPEIQTGQAALQTGLIEGPGLLLLLGVSLLLPLGLHVVTASISAVGASRSRRAYAVALSVAIVVHLAYNYTIFQVVSTGV